MVKHYYNQPLLPPGVKKVITYPVEKECLLQKGHLVADDKHLWQDNQTLIQHTILHLLQLVIQVFMARNVKFIQIKYNIQK